MALFKRKLTFVDEAGKAGQEEDKPLSLVERGDLVRDRITKFKGVVTCVLLYLHGCARVAVKSLEMKDGKPIDEQYFDDSQLEIIEAGYYFKQPEKVAAKLPGGENDHRDTGRGQERKLVIVQ